MTVILLIYMKLRYFKVICNNLMKYYKVLINKNKLQNRAIAIV